MKLAIVDYGMGNLHSLVGALDYVSNIDVLVSSNIKDLRQADKLILPGVGHFLSAMACIKDLGLDAVLKELVIEEKTPILGICLGMQLLTDSSDEGGYSDGLGFINGRATRFNSNELPVPHVGYNQVNAAVNSRLYDGFGPSPDFYFTHSHQLQSDCSIGQSTCHYGNDFIASFEYENIAGVQFHPELSQTNGLKLLKNFVELF
ncbi:imidazole glycerol phosphate synthase subunit HisH [Neptuniibacter pectenicola]|uniref:imidazole glycerol phosphate synthase subunit HisH n=1 Tax=Neptuniibacter pectenicola TaxID=1806669 RepID=UPI00082EC0E6|nr:imidazole glycerol phosphate synthase subunit HisH [Neptuniibacter pectenicola]